MHPFVKRLKQLQDVFGYVNDVATAAQLESICEQHARDSPECQRAVGYALGWHTAQAEAHWKSAEKRRQAFQEAGPFWR